MLSACQRPQKLAPVHVILKRLASVDEDYGHLFVVLLPQFRIGIDVHFAPREAGFALHLHERFFYHVAKMTTLARIHHHIVHRRIVIAFLLVCALPILILSEIRFFLP